MTAGVRGAWRCPPAAVLAAVDFGDASARAVALAGAIASAAGARLRVLHAERFEPPPYFTLDQIERLEDERRAAQLAASAHLLAFAAGATAHEVEPVIVDEPPVDAVLHAAGSADLIVVGTHGRRGPGRWWLGSVAERIVRGAAIPVLVTRAAAGPVAGVFERIAVVLGAGTPDEGARIWAQYLGATLGGRILDGGDVTSCHAEAVQQASLVVVAATGEHRATLLADPVASVLQSCGRPVLFVPTPPEFSSLPTLTHS